MVARTILLYVAAAAAHSVELHGSGTTNPSRLFWQAMEIIEERTKHDMHMTYRAVGSSTGQREFLGATNNNEALNDFGAGDIPVTNSRYQSVLDAGRRMVHVPFALGAIGVFHSVPTAELPTSGEIHVTGCVLAKIMSTQIRTWNDPEILALNPGMTATGTIQVVHRVQGSSSTAGFTAYLLQKCPADWTLGTGDTITWPASTNEAQGSGGMSAFIQSTPYAIGYIDAGHGHAANLGEIALQNADGIYVTSLSADIGASGTYAVTNNLLPNATADFSGVNLYDLPGATTYPIVLISYFYINQDLTALEPGTVSLLLAFVNFILSAEGQALAVTNLFSPLPTAILNYNQNTLNTLLTLPAGTSTYSIELASTTLSEVGAGDYVISGKRRSWAEYDRDQSTSDIAALQASLIAANISIVQPLSTSATPAPAAVPQALTVSDNGNTHGIAVAALGIAIVGLVFAVGSFVLLLTRGAGAGKPVQREVSFPKPVATSSTGAASTPGVELKHENV